MSCPANIFIKMSRFLHTGRNVCLFWKARGKFSLSSLKLSLFSTIFGSENHENVTKIHFNPTIDTMVAKKLFSYIDVQSRINGHKESYHATFSRGTFVNISRTEMEFIKDNFVEISQIRG
jgi:hypothetical protein